MSDHSKIKLGEKHLLLTETAGDKRKSKIRSDQFKEKRRQSRPSRGTKNCFWIGIQNSKTAEKRRYLNLKPPVSTVKLLYEIKETLKCRDRANHFINNCKSIVLEKSDLLIHPYLLGLWLGDGSSYSGVITTADPEEFTYLKNEENGFYWFKTRKNWQLLKDRDLVESDLDFIGTLLPVNFFYFSLKDIFVLKQKYEVSKNKDPDVGIKLDEFILRGNKYKDIRNYVNRYNNKFEI